MYDMKDYIAIGCRYLTHTGPDLDSWSKRMLGHFGEKVQPHLPEIRQWSLVLHSRTLGPVTLRQNCWEFMKCGKEAGGRRAAGMGSCPASTETRLHAIHGGVNAGRACWAVDGTLCRSGPPDPQETKKSHCACCGFYLSLLQEEHPDLLVSDEMLVMLL
jgi:hypothetical protein